MKQQDILRLTWISLICGFLFFIFGNRTLNWETLGLNLFISTLYTIPIGIANGWMNDELSKHFSWVHQTKKRVIYGVIGTILINVLLVYLLNYINFIWIQQEPEENFFNGKMNFRNWFIINMSLLISAIMHAKGFIESWKKASKQEVVEQKIIAKSANAQFESLKNQLDPHFLFNSLNVLSSLIEENPLQAQRFTADMSKIYRYVLEQKDKETIKVSEEIAFAKTYCDLLKTRFEDSIHIDIQVNESDENYLVVPLSLQLLLENCIKHNKATTQSPLTIKIYTKDQHLVVENNRQKRESLQSSSGVGLSNIVQRYALLSNQAVSIETTEDNFIVKVPILSALHHRVTKGVEQEKTAYQKALERVQELKKFYAHLITYLSIMAFIITFNLCNGKSHWFWFPLFGWGIGLAIHALKTFAIGRDWEENKIKSIIKNQ